MQSPIKVTHALVLEVWHSVFQENARGERLPTPTPGQMRVLHVDKPVVVPSCAFIPEMMDLPSCECRPPPLSGPTTHSLADESLDSAPCPVCKAPPSEQACRGCVSAVPHARHDHDPRLVGNPNGVCPRCEKRFITDDITGKWQDCACGLNIKNIEQRMRAVSLFSDSAGANGTSPGDASPPHAKEAESRGRQSPRGSG